MVDWRHGDKVMSDLADEVERLAHQQCPTAQERRAKALRLIDITLEDIEVGYFNRDDFPKVPTKRQADAFKEAFRRGSVKPGDPPFWPPPPRPVGVEPRLTPSNQNRARVAPTPAVKPLDGFRPAPPAEPRGPLALRWELWWMRRRLWWMRARLDPITRQKARQAVILGTAGHLGGALLAAADTTRPLPEPFPWWVVPLFEAFAVLGTWAVSCGWRTPTTDQAVSDAP